MYIPPHPTLSEQELSARLAAWAAESNRFPWLSSQDLSEWFHIVEEACEDTNIASSQWADAAVVLISEPNLKSAVQDRREQHLKETGQSQWEWLDFKDDLRELIVNGIPPDTSTGTRNPSEEGNDSPQHLAERLSAWASQQNRYPWFSGSSKDLLEWFTIVEEAFEDNQLSHKEYTEAAIFFISGDLKPVMEERRLKYLEKSGDEFWSWDGFKEDITRVIDEAERIIAQEQSMPGGRLGKTKNAVSRFNQDHPYIAASANAGLVVGGAMIFVPALGLLALHAIGITLGGVAVTSVAAAMRSVAYGGATAGFYSVMEYIGAKKPKEETPKKPEDQPAPLANPPPYESMGEGTSTPVQYAVFKSKRRRQ
ncbi:hypothetical protein CC1G_13574 [Coprinopsis cinerea okayama7|uniref:Transmembrane protein n=1 Tax=Coprinopsis cinerea (strain Okayama-7 / 130 / ATCC MYA-4618 / FGSC 9003) TaxID=240176 RepID=D6RJN5_COPC7|nr:hypothetical protein CC1G_13574 [Coprinopsis cinerea okayama7\|eukprot:XP_002912046.1 hypothetical protein CC1G_13574 [Coprinopsis cinerea okayama7\